MAIPNGIQTAALIAGTVIAASGLNLGVIGLGAPEATVEPADDAPAADPEGPTGPAFPAAAPAPQPAAQPSARQPDGQPPMSAHPVASPPSPRPAQPSVAPTPIPTAAIPTAAIPTTAIPTTAQAATPPSQPVTQFPATQPPTTQPPTTQPPANQPPATQTEYLTYEFDGIADIVIARHDGDRLEFWSVARAPGWVSRVDDNGPGKVKVKFMRLADGEEAEFEVKVGSDGDLDVKMEA